MDNKYLILVNKENPMKNEELYREYLEHSSDYEDNDDGMAKEEADKIRKRYAILLGEQVEEDDDEMKEGDMVMTFTADETTVGQQPQEEKKEKKSKKNLI